MRNVLVLGCLLALVGTSPAAAQGSVGDVVPERAIRITVGGSIDLNLVARNEQFFRAALAGGVLDPGTPTTASGGDVFLDPIISLDLTVQLREGVTAVVQLETPYSEQGDAGGINTTTAGSESRVLDVEQVFVRWEGAFDSPDLTLQVGIQDFSNDFAGTGNPFFVDVSHSENPFDSATGAPPAPSSWMVGTQEASGIFTRYNAGDVDLDLFYFTIGEGLRGSTDMTLDGATLQTDSGPDTDQPWNLGAGLYVLESDADSRLFTLGGGGSTTLMDGALKLYGEAYGQFGSYAEMSGSAGDIDQEDAFAVFGGARFTMLDTVYQPYIDVSYWEISGDSNTTDGNNENFVSLEGNNDTLIVEDGYYGFDIDTNYRAIKVRGGFTPADWDRLRVEVLYAFFELQDNNGTLGAPSSTQDKIGDELDIVVDFFATEYLTFRVATGGLFDPDALGLGDDVNSSRIEARVKF
ncbi:MAG: alginate export family protein [Planctomycetota bacterium]